MKKLSTGLLAGLLFLVSCGPMTYVLPIQSRQPSPSGLDLSGKSMSVIYLEDADSTYSSFNNVMADGLAYTLEMDFFDGEEGVKVYNLLKDPDGDYASVDTASQYVLLLDSDVVMILDTPETDGARISGKIPFVSKLYVYDSMGEDKVTMLQCKSSVTSFDETAKGVSLGNALASPLMPEWKLEAFSMYYFESSNKWIKALDHACGGELKEAIDIWMGFVKSDDAFKASAACYNIATACFLLEQKDLAAKWLDMSDSYQPMPLAPGLRKRISGEAISD